MFHVHVMPNRVNMLHLFHSQHLTVSRQVKSMIQQYQIPALSAFNARKNLSYRYRTRTRLL